jgi:hypothetical protein
VGNVAKKFNISENKVIEIVTNGFNKNKIDWGDIKNDYLIIKYIYIEIKMLWEKMILIQ